MRGIYLTGVLLLTVMACSTTKTNTSTPLSKDNRIEKLHRKFKPWRNDSFACYERRKKIEIKYLWKDSSFWYSLDTSALLYILGPPNYREEGRKYKVLYYWTYLMPACDKWNLVLNKDSLAKEDIWPDTEIFFEYENDSLKTIMGIIR